MSRKRQSGHYCWSCERRRANEKFSGKGHARHLCKDFTRLGKEELAYRQTIRDLDRLLTWNGHIPRRNREQFRKYLNHKDERIRAYARQIEATDALNRGGTTASARLGRLSSRAGRRDMQRRGHFSAKCGLFRRSHSRGRYGNPIRSDRGSHGHHVPTLRLGVRCHSIPVRPPGPLPLRCRGRVSGNGPAGRARSGPGCRQGDCASTPV